MLQCVCALLKCYTLQHTYVCCLVLFPEEKVHAVITFFYWVLVLFIIYSKSRAISLYFSGTKVNKICLYLKLKGNSHFQT